MILLFAFISLPMLAQTDTLLSDPEPLGVSSEFRTSNNGDTLIIEGENKAALSDSDMMEHSPKKAMIYSLILPGAGQAYNKKYYKIPFVYGVLGGVGYWVYYNTDGYRQASANYTNDPNDTNERYLRAWRRNLELSYIALAAAHALQVLDAYVDAYLFYWDVNPELTIRLSPSIEPLYMPGGMPAGNYGLKCKLIF